MKWGKSDTTFGRAMTSDALPHGRTCTLLPAIPQISEIFNTTEKKKKTEKIYRFLWVNLGKASIKMISAVC